MDELCLGVGEVTVLSAPADWTPEERPPSSNSVGTNAVFTMETRRGMEKEEERWRKLYPEIKKCVILIPRQTLDTPKQAGGGSVEDGSRRPRSGDTKTRDDWMQPGDLNDRKERLGRFVKKVEVSVQPDQARESSLLRLKQSPDVTTERDTRRCRSSSRLRSKRERESCGPIREVETRVKHHISHPQTDHNYCSGEKSTPDTPDSQSQDASSSSSCAHNDGDACSMDKNLPPVVFRKVRGRHWVLGRSEVEGEEEREEEEEEEKDEDADGSAINTDQRKQGNLMQSMSRRRRRQACGRCVACLTKDCGKCVYCLDKRKFGGPGKRKQRCRFRLCLVVLRKNIPQPVETLEAGEVTVTTATETTEHLWTRRLRDDEQEEVRAKRNGTWGRKWRGKKKKKTCLWMRREEERKGKRKENKKWRKKWRERKAKRKLDDVIRVKVEDLKEEEEEPPQIGQFQHADEAGEPLPEGDLTGTVIQLNLSLDGSYFAPSILSDSTLTINNQSELLPQEDSELSVSTGLLPPPPLPLQLKEEEEAVEIVMEMEEEGRTEAPYSAGVTDRGRYYEVEVELEVSDSDEETLTASSEGTHVTDDDIVLDPAYKHPEFISLSSSSLTLWCGRSDEVTCGRGLLQLLWMLRQTVLPAHWVPVLAGGPLLQLLQCSKLSSMADTIVHIQQDRCFYITIQSRQLPETHPLYGTYSQRMTHLSQLVSLLLELERLIICQGLKVRSPACPPEVRSPACHLLVAPPCLTCLPCLLQEEEEEDTEEDDDEGGDEVGEDDL